MVEENEPSELKERILREQQLSGEREDRPERFGGMPESPVEGTEGATPRAKREPTPVDEIEATKSKKRDIQSDGS